MAKRNVQLVQDSVNGLETSNGINVAEVTGAVTNNAIARFNGATGAIQNSGVVIDDSGNVGFGITPSAWSAYWKVLQNGNSPFYTAPALPDFNNIGANFYVSGSSDITFAKYISNGYASLAQQFNGAFTWKTAPSGTAGSAIAWNEGMTLDANSKLAVTGGISVGNVANAGATVLDWYEEATATLTATGMTTAPTISCKFTRIGNVVTAIIGYLNGTSNSTSFTFTGVPTSFRPTTSAYTSPIAVKDNGIYSLGLGIIDASGNITLNKDYGGTLFTATGSKGTNTCTFTYIL